MGLLDSSGVSADGRRVTHIRVDRIGNVGGNELWWVALAFDDESTKPEGMFASYDSAAALGERLAKEHGVQVVRTEVG
jgi:phosphomannomutase